MHGRQDFSGFFLGQIRKRSVRSCHFDFVVVPVFFLGFRQCIKLRGGDDVFLAYRFVLIFHAGRKHHADKGAIIVGFTVMMNNNL